MALPGYDITKTDFPGLDRTSAGLGGNIPQQTLTGYSTRFEKQLFKSTRDIALLLDKTFRAGYGCLPIGTVVAEDQNTGNLVPYTPDTISQEDVSRVFSLTDLIASGVSGEFDVAMMESYKFDAGDVIVLTDTDGSYEEKTINSIDRASSNIKATVSLNTGVGSDFTVAKSANAYLKAEDAASGKRSVAKYIIDAEVDTGAGEYRKGGLGSVVLSNAVLNKDVVDENNIDATAMTSLGNITADGTYYVLK